MKHTILLIPILISSLTSSCQTKESDSTTIQKIEKSEKEWKKELSPSEYNIIREKGTEPAFTGEYWNEKKEGVYHCKACNLPLFESNSKFKSGTGWPSFHTAIENNVGKISDTSYGWNRTEIICNQCNGHLGHVFSDGPKPTGLRYCVNSASLKLEPTK